VNYLDQAAASAPGKIILIGEHFVVHGSYAVAAAINKRAKVTILGAKGKVSSIISGKEKSRLFAQDSSFAAIKAVSRCFFKEFGKPKENITIKIESEIPRGSGLGSSAAISIAASAALSRFYGLELESEKILGVAMDGEKAVHGNPSGIDTATSLKGGMILFKKNVCCKSINLNRSLQFLIVYSGVERTTSRLVSKVARRKNSFPSQFSFLTEASSFASLELVEAISRCDLPYLGALMNLSQAALSWIGASTPKLDFLIEELLRRDDCYGAKLTGAGGGGSVIGLPKPDKVGAVLSTVSKHFELAFLASTPQDGLRWE
jgi:mevalonate kinase